MKCLPIHSVCDKMLTRTQLAYAVLAIFYLNVISCGAYRILGVFPMAAKSHYFLGSAALRALADAGHDVTIISPYSEPNPPKNGSWREIVLEEQEKFIHEKVKQTNFHKNTFSFNPFQMITMMNNMTVTLTEMAINHRDVQKLMRSGEQFDVVIVTEFMMDAIKGFAWKFNAHLVSFSNSAAMSWYLSNIGNHIPPSAKPEAMTSYPPQMTFFQRLPNTIVHVFLKAIQEYVMYPDHQKLLDKYFPGCPRLEELQKNVSLVLVNSHISLNDASQKIPIMIEIGGIHVKPPKKLPADLQKTLDNAKEGVIYFSMGSHLNSADLPPEKINAIVKTFAKRKEKILWKHADDKLEGKPDHVQLGKWFPQQEILAHPNVKLFVTHNGFLSTTETIYHGVPIVGIPIMGDQKMNAKSAAHAGYGISIFVEDLTEESFGQAVEEVISNPKYKENVMLRAKLFHDRQNTPAQEVVYWIEYVIRHNGAKHLRVPYLDLHWYQYYLIDVFLFIIAVLLLGLYILKKFFGFLIRKCILRKQKVKTS